MRSSPYSLPFRHCLMGFLEPFLAFFLAESVQGCWEDPTQQRIPSPRHSWCLTAQPYALVLTLGRETLHTGCFSPTTSPRYRSHGVSAAKRLSKCYRRTRISGGRSRRGEAEIKGGQLQVKTGNPVAKPNVSSFFLLFFFSLFNTLFKAC